MLFFFHLHDEIHIASLMDKIIINMISKFFILTFCSFVHTNDLGIKFTIAYIKGRAKNSRNSVEVLKSFSRR